MQQCKYAMCLVFRVPFYFDRFAIYAHVQMHVQNLNWFSLTQRINIGYVKAEMTMKKKTDKRETHTLMKYIMQAKMNRERNITN